ncbi:Uu.00g013420.m01.CDS01 [Anthostomella pinea]|uniref:Uu.00g013420.m01.CDS01 n=1 Tax=Anthostomella pinea TaxID=933095 RepID=A0AAI8VY48_9PEZI|nr:Uu.00g013420.m01.CDS01 [Anthostomella pinea]
MATVDGLPLNAKVLPTGTTAQDSLPANQKPKKAKDKTGAPPSRFSLHATAKWWRSLQCIGMGLHFMASPRPPSPAFNRTIPSTLALKPGEFVLHFYLPAGYTRDKKSDKWPVVVNYHGGGFTLGKAQDDARFARFVVEKSIVFVSVDYRLAPESPFPTAVDDGADALLYIINNAAELRIDPMRIATSGFSAGGNIALTAPMRLHLHSKGAGLPEHRIVAVATWYPITDYTLSRVERRDRSVRPEHTLPPTLTNLFDQSYLFPPELDLADPCLSPSKAPDELLKEAMPPNILFFTCEWDMLLQEGEELARRLDQPPISKNVFYTMIHEVAHGWDKGPNPMRPPQQSEKLYLECCKRLRKIFDGEDPRWIFGKPRRVPTHRSTRNHDKKGEQSADSA